MSQSPLIGAPMPRKEDAPLLRGAGRFTDDFQPPGMLHAVFVRSPHPHADLEAIDVQPARDAPGVCCVLTHRDLEAAGITAISALTRTPPHAVYSRDGSPVADLAQYPLARGRVRYAGEPVAMVVAETLAAARDGAERVAVSYRPRAALITVEDCLAPDAAALFDDMPDNQTLDWVLGDAGACDRAFAGAAQVARVDLVNNRIAPVFMEPRAALAEFDPGYQAGGDADPGTRSGAEGGRYTLTAGTQTSHGVHGALLGIMGLQAAQLRVVTPHTGGGFGARGLPYPEYAPLLLAARLVGAPVKWTAERGEAFLSDAQARDHRLRGELALDADGHFTALRVRIDWRHGAYLAPRNMKVMVSFLPPTLGGVYRIGLLDLQLRAVVSSTTPQAAYRGIGRVEATYLIESLVEAAAEVTGIDALELRRRNLVGADAFPWTAAGGAVYTSGRFRDNLERALQLADQPGFAARRTAARQRGQLRGLGVAMFIENDGGAPSEYAQLIARADGTVRANVGTQDFGMGHQTVYSQVLADRLGLPFEAIEVCEGDTDAVASGFGSHGSRSARIGGGALVQGALALIERGRELAAAQLEAAAADIEFAAGSFRVSGTDRVSTLAAVADFAAAQGQRLDAEVRFETSAEAHSNGCQICELEVDPETGKVTLLRHVIVADVGRVLNPLIVDGQMHGGLAQGLGQAALEAVVYASDGQTLSGSFMDYALPRADDMPCMVTAYNEIAEADNPLGVKGAGEGPTSGSPAAFMNALRDAIGAAAAARVSMPATPERVWRALRG